MPTNNVTNRTFQELFDAPVRFEIPFFQRGYAWEQPQWKKLFEDIDQEIIEGVENGNFSDQEHFFGPVVVLEKISDHPTLKKFLVIDGQQRITTVYLLLAILKRMLDGKSHLSPDAATYSSEITRYLQNNVTGGDDYLKLKVYSTKGDRFPTYKAVFGTNPSSPNLIEDQLLYDQETNRIDAFVKYAAKILKNYDVPRLWQIYQSLIKSLRVVWIPLNADKDDPQAIFESLNAAGMPLSASELLCNYIFRPLADDSNNLHEKLHNEKWLRARREIGDDEFDEYLRNLFSIGENKRVGKDRRMYVHFKARNKRLTAASAIKVLEQIMDYTSVYKYITQPISHPYPQPDIKNILIDIKDTDMGSINPFLMALLKAFEANAITLENTVALLRETYVLLIRRKIAQLRITQFDTFFPPLLPKIIHEPDIVKAFQTLAQKEQLWVPDQIFEAAFLDKAIYNIRELPFSRHVLQKIDRQMQKFGELPDYSTIPSIEHILPQSLDAHWKLYLGPDSLDNSLPSVIHTLGNLCLDSIRANSAWGQLPFADKQKEYNVVSALARDVKEKRKDPWNIAAIKQRSRDMAQHALIVWKWNL